MTKVLKTLKDIASILSFFVGPAIGVYLDHINKMTIFSAFICMVITVWGAALGLYLWRILPMEKKLVKDPKFLYDHEKPDNFYVIIENRLSDFEKKLGERIENNITRENYLQMKPRLPNIASEGGYRNDLSLMERMMQIEHILKNKGYFNK
ncbi:MAG: hypothetical protein IPP15_15995 [Saprospiraceae bacterium]|uniref:Uncharacterized protein n=1 Tax=Candidatus Opimibacter skivensis TaxID=2982028 RepID=A0A9D7XNW8_9BACT|nr:hypothetical protein [Candidatus Opimibacter skivensis]